jgi:hypothetical protein
MCNLVPTTPDPSSQFNCGDGQQIDNSLVCNFITDCLNGQDEKVCADCNFEDDSCQWVNGDFYGILWTRSRGTESKNGPTVDHSKGTPLGYYMYLEDTFHGGFSSADLVLDTYLKPCSPTCELEFYYHALGDSDDLTVYLLIDNSYVELVHLKGDFGDKWNLQRIGLGRVSKNFKLEFEGYRFGDSFSDLAIDDVKLRNCQFPPVRPNGCPSNYFTCERKACVQMNRVCDLIDDCGDASDEVNCANYTSCDFENGLCDWTHDVGSSFKWMLSSGYSFSWGTGPNRDHTTGTSAGSFVLMDASGQDEGDKARILSSIFTPILNQKCEVRLFYHMHGVDMGTFNIFSRTSLGGNEKLLFTKNRDLGDIWERAIIEIDDDTKPFQIIVEGIVGKDYLSDIAIDDVTFTPGCGVPNSQTVLPSISTTTVPTTTGLCASDEFQCTKGSVVCVALNKVCNFVTECEDGSDEQDCGSCDFENGWCGWRDDSDDDGIWRRRKAPAPNQFGPQVDHTTSSVDGHFLVGEIDGVDDYSETSRWYDLAILLGPVFQETSPYCKMVFYSYMYRGAELQVFYSNATNLLDYTHLASIGGDDFQPDWRKNVIEIGKRKAGYLIELMAEPDVYDEANGEYFNVHIDDVEFQDCGAQLVVLDKDLDCDFEKDFCNYIQVYLSFVLKEKIFD